jgi:hypothetical protein
LFFTPRISHGFGIGDIVATFAGCCQYIIGVIASIFSPHAMPPRYGCRFFTLLLAT